MVQFSDELKKTSELLRGRERAALYQPLKTFLEKAELFIKYHESQLSNAGGPARADPRVDSLVNANARMEETLERLERKMDAAGDSAQVVSSLTYSSAAKKATNTKSIEALRRNKHVVLIKDETAKLTPAELKTVICNTISPNSFEPLNVKVNKTNIAIEVPKEEKH